jgi:UDP-N-acetylmuramate dehydrogenase
MLQNFSLKPFNTFGIPAQARYYMRLESVAQWAEVLAWPQWGQVPVLLLGGGSNILFTQNFEGLVVHNALKGIEKVKEDEDFVWIKAFGGENWHEFVMHCLQNGWGGLENLSLIPGTVGASPIQNIGAYGVEVKDCLESLEALRLQTGALQTFSNADCQFGYRNSIFKQEAKGQFLIVSVTFKLTKRNHTLHLEYGAIGDILQQWGIQAPSIQEVSRAVIHIRQSKLPDPAQIGNCGSFFKNPEIAAEAFASVLAKYPKAPHYPLANGMVKVPAGWLIEQCGFKGTRQGNVGVYQHQALVLVNHGGATGAEALALAKSIQYAVKERFNIDIEPEVNLI